MLSINMGRCLCTCLTGMLFSVQTWAYPQTNLVWTFNSRPDLSPPKFEFTIFNESLITPGYVLMAPYTVPLGSNLADSSGSSLGATNATAQLAELALFSANTIQNGPYIFDGKGNLVYSGYGSAGALESHDVKLAQYRGTPHLSFFQGNDLGNGDRGHGIIMNKAYHAVATVQPGLGRTAGDSHEFTVLPGGTAIITIAQPTQYDLTAFGVEQAVGWVLQGIFQEVDIETGEVLFEWRSLDHVDPSQTFIGRNSSAIAGDGVGTYTSWDYFHMNAVEKDVDGNYLISSRHTCALYKISGMDGSIIWQLNGMKNEFSLEGFNNTFSFQHDARIQSQNETTTIISLMDNANSGAPVANNDMTSAYSAGMIMAVNNDTMTTTLLREYHIPDGGVVSNSQGSVQPLENSNVFIGWGAQPFISEFTAEGDCIMLGQFGANNSLAENYRAFKINWVGTPDSTPALWTSANSTRSPTTFYVSWNGATEIVNWRFFGGVNASNVSVVLGTSPKEGFETTFVAYEYYGWGYAEALDQKGAILGVTPVKQTYVPAQNVTFASGGG